ncbi:MAG: hypothetical protein GVY32_05005 [Gammaproteobacteria bacterium]|jgi:type II secretory pathway component PulJ|nr:hypothetical protein [Gammaproteobacteria bacterium]
MSLSMGTLLGQMVFVLVALVLTVVLMIAAIRFLFAATRWMNRKADLLELEHAASRRGKPEAR